MVTFLKIAAVFLSATFSPSAQALYSPGCGVGNILVAGTCLSGTNLITLHCPPATNGASDGYTICLNASDGVTPYTPSGATKLRIKAMSCNFPYSANGGSSFMGYATLSSGYLVGTPTGWTYMGAQKWYAALPMPAVSGNTGFGHAESLENWIIPNAKYGWVLNPANSTTSGSCLAYGYEE